jgi:hypothetical protein
MSLIQCAELHQQLYYCRKLFLPDCAPLHLYVFEQHQDKEASDHSGQAKTFEIVAQGFIWFGMCKDIAMYIHTCHTCQRSYTWWQRSTGVLRSLSISSRPWTNISINFITGPPWSEEYHVI